MPAPALPHGRTWRETAGITPGWREFRWGMPCDVPEGTPTGFRGYFFGPSPGVAAGAATPGYVKVPLQGTTAMGVVRDGGSRAGLGRFHQPAHAGPFADAAGSRPTWDKFI
jgi:hypothetical protein